MRCSAEWLLAREGEPSYRIFIVAGLRLLLNAIASILEITSSWAKGVQITCTMSEPAVGTPHWKDTHYQIRHLPLTEQFDKELHQGNIDTVFYVLQPYSLFGSSFICPINLHTHEAMRPFHSLLLHEESASCVRT